MQIQIAAEMKLGAPPVPASLEKTRRVTQFRLLRANAGPGDDGGAGYGWTLARGGSLRTWNGVCLTAFSGLGRGLFPREGNKIPLPPSLPLPYRTAAGRVKEFLHALARVGDGGAFTGTPPGVPGKTRR